MYYYRSIRGRRSVRMAQRNGTMTERCLHVLYCKIINCTLLTLSTQIVQQDVIHRKIFLSEYFAHYNSKGLCCLHC